jgi:DNA-binding CsgD family transcriptional regulator
MDAPMERRLRAVMDVAYGDASSGDPWPALLEALYRAVPCDSLSLLELDHAGHLVAHRDYPELHVADEVAYAEGYRLHLATCPPCADPSAVGDRYGVASLSDVYAAPEQHARDPRAAHFRAFATKHAVQIAVAATARIVFCRADRDFSAHERLLIGVLRPHLTGVYRAGQRQRSALTDRQQQILALVAGGHTNAEVAMRLGLSVGTVRKHLDNVYATMGVSSRAAAVARFARA